MIRIFVLIYAAGLLLIWLGVEVSQWFLVPLLLLVIISGVVLVQQFRCPNCNKPVLINPIRVLGTEIWIYTVLPPKKCSKCGTELN